MHFYRSYCRCENFFIFLGVAALGQLWERAVNTDMTLTIDLVRVCSVFRGGTCMYCLLSGESIKLNFKKKKKKTEIFQGRLQGRMSTTE